METTFDKHGRMQYHPDFHPNHGKSWLAKDEQYLIEMYEKIGPDQCALNLGRTLTVVSGRASRLRKQGIMPKRTIKTNFKRNGNGE